MKKIILSLVIAGLSASNNCFGMKEDTSSKTVRNVETLKIGQTIVPSTKHSSLSKSDLCNTKKSSIEKNLARYALCTSALISTCAFAYFFIPGISGFINSKAKSFANFARNKSKLIDGKPADLINFAVSKETIENQKNSPIIKNIKNNRIIEKDIEYKEVGPAYIFEGLSALPFVFIICNTLKSLFDR